MRLYTRKGDTGQTDLLGARVGKDDERIELIGEIDETTSSIGLARSSTIDPRLNDYCIEIQRDLYKMMAELAFTDELRPSDYELGPDRTDWLEALTDQISAEIALEPAFVIPGDTQTSATFDLARAVTRRAERCAVNQQHRGLIANAEILRYLNRLSSFLFVAARLEDQRIEPSSTPAKS